MFCFLAAQDDLVIRDKALLLLILKLNSRQKAQEKEIKIKWMEIKRSNAIIQGLLLATKTAVNETALIANYNEIFQMTAKHLKSDNCHLGDAWRAWTRWGKVLNKRPGEKVVKLKTIFCQIWIRRTFGCFFCSQLMPRRCGWAFGALFLGHTKIIYFVITMKKIWEKQY